MKSILDAGFRTLERMVRLWLLRNRKPNLIFKRACDGKETDADCCLCQTCKNYFWVQHAAIELPVACPFCRRVFTGAVEVDNDEMKKAQVL